MTRPPNPLVVGNLAKFLRYTMNKIRKQEEILSPPAGIINYCQLFLQPTKFSKSYLFLISYLNFG